MPRRLLRARSRRLPAPTAFAATLGIALVAACGDDGTSPRAIAATYVLDAVGGAPVPFTMWSETLPTGEQSSGTIVADTLALASDGRYRTADAFRLTVTRGGIVVSDTVVRSVLEGRYRIEGRAFTFVTEPCPPNALCAAPPVGELSPDGRRLTYGVMPNVRRYARVEP